MNCEAITSFYQHLQTDKDYAYQAYCEDDYESIQTFYNHYQQIYSNLDTALSKWVLELDELDDFASLHWAMLDTKDFCTIGSPDN